MKINKNVCKNLIVVVISIIVTSQVAMSEGVPCAPNVEGLHYTTPHYNYSPVLFSNMPYDVMISYILIDSILRHSEEAPVMVNSFLERFMNGEISFDNDTLNYAYKYLYKIMDYDPLLFWDYIMKGTAYGRNIHTFHLYDDLSTGCVEKLPRGWQKQLLLRSFYILHIYVNETNLFVKNKTANNPLKDFTIVYSQVLDTIKGKVLPNMNTAYIYDKSDTNNIDTTASIEKTIPNNTNLIFDYCNQWNLNGDGELYYYEFDEETGESIPIGALQDKDGNTWVKPNREYIVFLSPNYECTYNRQFYYALWPIGGVYYHGMFPVEDGNVLDKKNEWGWGTSVPIETFKQNMNSLINEFKNYGE